MDRTKQCLAVAAFLALVLVAVDLSGWREQFSLVLLQQRLEDHRWGGLAFFALLFVLGNLAQIPGWIFLAAAVLALGRGWGGLVTYAAASLACAVTFFTVHLVGGDALRRLPGRTPARILGQLDARPIRSVVLLRILFQTLPALNYALALSGIGFWRYMAGTLLGLPLPIAAYCLFFDQLGRWFAIGVP